MSQVQPPYFFPEVLRSAWKERDRERHFGISANDRKFLRSLPLSSDEERRKQVPPMIAQTLWLNTNSPAELELVGSFIMSSTGTYTNAFLYTPYGGLEKFESRALLLSELTERFNTPAKADELLQFIALGTRSGLRLPRTLLLTPVDIEGDVFDEQKAAIDHQQTLNLQAALAELVKLPSLDTMLQALLTSVFHSLFPKLDPNRARVNFFKLPPTEGEPRQWVSSLSISTALLMIYRQQTWPVGQTREFFHPQSITTSNDATRWEDGLKQASEQLSSFLQNALETFWNTESPNGTSRRELLAHTMEHKARVDLLLKRQSEIITPEQADQLAALYRPNGGPRSLDSAGLRFETVRFWEHASHFVELSSSVMIANAHTWFYSPPKGLQVLADHDGLIQFLKAMVKAPAYEDDAYNFLSLEERLLFIGFTEPSVSGNLIDGNVFEHLMEGIIDKQQQNLIYVLGQFRRERGDINLSALLDHATDVRFMVDDKLLTLDTAHRWTTHSVLADPFRPISVAAKRAEQLHKQLIDIPHALENLIKPLPSIMTPLADALASHERQALDPARVFINRYTEEAAPYPIVAPLESQSLEDHFVERLAEGVGPVPETRHYGVYKPDHTAYGQELSHVDVKTLNRIVNQVLAHYKEHDICDIPRKHLQDLLPQMGTMMSNAMRNQAYLRRLNKTLNARDDAIIQAVFDPFNPDRRRREDLEGFIPDVYHITVQRDEETLRHRLANCLMITERGGLDHHHSGHAILWTPAWGLETFVSPAVAEQQLEERLKDPTACLALLENLDPRLRQLHPNYSLGAFWLITEPISENRQQSWIDHYIAQRAHWLAQKPTGKALLKLMAVPPTPVLGGAAQLAHYFVAQRSLPAWLGMASPAEQQHHAELLEQYRLNTQDEKDYLYEFLSLHQQVHDKLNDMLVDYSVDPEDVFITPRLALDGQRQNLTDYALAHISEQASSFTVESSATQLTESTVRQLLLKLDIAQVAHDYLKEKLAPDQPGAVERELRFIRQLPWQLLQHAHALKLQERLSETGYDLIRQVVDMPDAIARATIAGANATIRPLEMIATPGASIVKALGLYVISAGATEPLILYAPYYPGQCFIEFENLAQFLSHLNVPGKLQDWITAHLPAADKAKYKNLLASTAGTTSEITLANQPIKGHAFKQFYQDNQVVMGQMLKAQQDPEEQSRWNTIKSLLSSGVQIAAQFLPGKLQIPVLIWQSYRLFKDSAEALQQHHWRDALRSFIFGIARMAEMGQLMREPVPKAPPPAYEEVNASAPGTANTAVAPTVKDIDVTDPRRTRLQDFETSQVALQDLQKQAGSGLYATADGKTLYGAVEGKVYTIKKTPQLRITDLPASSEGPLLSSTPQHQLVLDPDHHPLRYGQVITRLGNDFVSRFSAGLGMNIEASGMKEIRRLYPTRAWQIIEALDIARTYAFRAMHNMAQLQKRTKGTRLEGILKRVFDVGHIDIGIRKKVYDAITPLCKALQDPDLDGWEMSRFVVGARRQTSQEVVAFVVVGDKKERVFFTDLFFDQRMLQHEYANLLTAPFNIAGHARASALIHEFSHLYSRTEDICYTDVRRPFLDLIDTSTKRGRDEYALLKDYQDNVLSLRTPFGQLFSRWFPSSGSSGSSGSSSDSGGSGGSGNWVSMDSTNSHDLAAKAIMEATATTSINDARIAFLNTASADKRIDTILRNADSVTQLICEMGRELDP
ncbi:dermonecrotic toxin domain-containing protein [Pseudomonas canadensis]|uniref:dermonecrotic toxin domain-containing protein n=1 Tax=Pseudomonas canadensis TaxID=915099 RepID=UPI003BA14C31